MVNSLTFWTRIISGVLTAGGVISLLAVAYGVVFRQFSPSITVWIVFFIQIPFGLYIFGTYALTGNMPKFLRR